MPVPGPRNQFGPDAGYRNPGMEQPNRINQWKRPGPLYWPGRSPGMMIISLRGQKLAHGTIRRLWRQSVNVIPAQTPFSWSQNGHIVANGPIVGLTRALRYMTHSLYMGQGTDNTRYAMLHTTVKNRNYYKTVTVNAGQKRNQPTVRNRLTSFGSRVPTLNTAVQGAQSQSPGGATQA